MSAQMTQHLHNVSKGQSSSAAKMKSLMGAMEIMTETRHAFQLIYNELLEEQVKIYIYISFVFVFLFLDCNTVGLSCVIKDLLRCLS